MARSASTSTAVPPWPNRITGPNTGSMLAPTISSRACERRTIDCTLRPASVASGRRCVTRASIACTAARSPAASSMSSTTPPTSDLWLMSGETIFSATGQPMASAAATAASASTATRRVATTGMP